ncbi:MAG: hypothetical protein PHX09_04250 [Clostridia bacterium]|nr:hypothetical protein [Clostridia bacterium]
MKAKPLILSALLSIIFLIALFLILFGLSVSNYLNLNNSNMVKALDIPTNFNQNLGGTDEEVDMQAITDENLKNALLYIYNTVYNSEKTQLFTNDFLEFENLNLTNYKIASIAGLNQFNFSNLAYLNLAFNNFQDNAFTEITEFALNNPNIRIILLFNKILNAQNYSENIVLGMQNLEVLYINSSPDNTYVLYEDYSNNYNFTVTFKSRLDNSTMFSTQEGTVLNVEPFEYTFPLTGYYTLSFVDKEKRVSFNFQLCCAEISLYNETLTVEAGSGFTGEQLNFSLGFLRENFIIEALNLENEEFRTNQLGEFTLKYYIYEKNSSSQKGELLLVLEQTIIVEDTSGPRITPNCEHAYSYIHQPYIDTGASAYDVIDGVCAIQVFGSIDINKEGIQVLTYKSIDSLGNESVFEKKVEIIYPPVKSIEISYQQLENFKQHTQIDFVISASSDNIGLISQNQNYKIYVNDIFVKTITENEFNIMFEKAGRNTLEIATVSYDNTGKEVIAKSEIINIDILEDYWWKSYLPKTLLVLIIFMIFIISGYIAYMIYTQKMNKLDLLYKYLNKN